MVQSTVPTFDTLNARSREVFRLLVEAYLEHGEPVGSRTLTRSLSESVSAATIRNVMQDLELLGVLDSPHVSAGRIPSDLGLRMFVDGILEVQDLDRRDQNRIEKSFGRESNDVAAMMETAGSLLSRLTRAASIVLVPRSEAPIRHIEFVSLSRDRALVVLVTADGKVENRLFQPPPGTTPSAMREAANFLNSIMSGHTVGDLKDVVEKEIQVRKREIDRLSTALIEKGVAAWDKESSPDSRLIVRGRSNLLDDATDEEDLERIRTLFDDLERKKEIVEFLELADTGTGVRIFIGSENKLFSLSGSSLVISPYINSDRRIVGAVGVIGPTRLNYGRVVPIVDYTAQLMSRLMSTQERTDSF